EPWDVGPGGYQVGNFPVLWTEWNGKYRDCVRSFWRGDGGRVSELATRLAGSSDLYASSGRRPYASINFVTAHDGFTLRDLVSYNDKHNQANGEDNADGDSNNLSWNCGAEGPTDDPAVLLLREKQRRNFFLTLLLSQGVPMICAGDEMGRTQAGNNNAYCQDNETSWIVWQLRDEDAEFLEFAREAIRLRLEHPVFRRPRFFQGRSLRGSGVKDITWFDPSGQEMTDDAWNADFIRSVMVRLAGDSIDEMDERGERIVDATFLLLLNAHHGAISFTLPGHSGTRRWEKVLDTAEARRPKAALLRRDHYRVRERSMVVLRLRNGAGR
ncbi:MAG TPA: glycogen debranching enzyme GlgX, partial [Thermoanaerobaculia bacterium]|nr:glycogen debranching enzyme GlgX [Thermoanaerobaculia bacterium]